MNDLQAFSALNDLLSKAALEEEEKVNHSVAEKSVVKTSFPLPSHVPEGAHRSKSGRTEREKGDDRVEEAIWDESEVDTAHDAALKVNDGRKKPEYDFVYKQAVGAETVYFGMGDVDPSSTCCTELVVKVKLPGQQYKDLDLDVQQQSLVVSSPEYRLATYLPFPVDSDSGSAKWIADTQTLVITLPILDQ